RKWRLVNVRNSPAITLTLNDPDADRVVLQMSLQRSVEGRATAVRIFGPKGTTTAQATQSGGGLVKQWTAGEEFTLTNAGPALVDAHVGARWQIADPTKRHTAKLLPEPVAVPSGGLQATDSGGVTISLS